MKIPFLKFEVNLGLLFSGLFTVFSGFFNASKVSHKS